MKFAPVRIGGRFFFNRRSVDVLISIPFFGEFCRGPYQHATHGVLSWRLTCIHAIVSRSPLGHGWVAPDKRHCKQRTSSLFLWIFAWFTTMLYFSAMLKKKTLHLVENNHYICVSQVFIYKLPWYSWLGSVSGVKRFIGDIQKMVGFDTVIWWWYRFCWLFMTPAIITVSTINKGKYRHDQQGMES